MNQRRAGRSVFATVVGVAALSAVAVAALFGWRAWQQRRFDITMDLDFDVAVESLLDESDSSRVRDLVKEMMNPIRSSEAVGQLRDHFEQRIREESPSAPLSMVYFVECLAPKFASLDTPTRLLNLTLVSEVMGWLQQNSASCWPAMLTPTKGVLQAALADSVPEVAVAALRIVRASWEWSPPEINSPAERKSLGTWKAELHNRSVELMRSHDQEVRAAAGQAVVSVPLESEAARGLVLLQDDSPVVRRAMLLALSQQPRLLANEDVLDFLRDEYPSVRAAADMVLSNRGLSREQIALASRATHPSPKVRAEAPGYIVESTAVDRAVWLKHLSRDPESSVRTAAVRALGKVGGEECTARLDEISQSDPDLQVRQLAAGLVGRYTPTLRRPSAGPDSVQTETLPTLKVPRAN